VLCSELENGTAPRCYTTNDVDRLSQQLVALTRTFSSHWPEESMLFQLPREFLSHRLLGDLPFANRKIGSRDIARLVTLSRATQTPSPECRWSTVNPREVATRDVKDLSFQSLSVDARCHVLYSTQSPWDPSQLATSRFICAPFDFANDKVPSPKSFGSRATCPCND
jgi:hypothetical protein